MVFISFPEFLGWGLFLCVKSVCLILCVFYLCVLSLLNFTYHNSRNHTEYLYDSAQQIFTGCLLYVKYCTGYVLVGRERWRRKEKEIRDTTQRSAEAPLARKDLGKLGLNPQPLTLACGSIQPFPELDDTQRDTSTSSHLICSAQCWNETLPLPGFPIKGTHTKQPDFDGHCWRCREWQGGITAQLCC